MPDKTIQMNQVCSDRIDDYLTDWKAKAILSIESLQADDPVAYQSNLDIINAKIVEEIILDWIVSQISAWKGMEIKSAKQIEAKTDHINFVNTLT